MSLSRSDCKTILMSLYPPGYFDPGGMASQNTDVFGGLLYALAGVLKTYGTDIIDNLRAEIVPGTSTDLLPVWEASLGLSQTPIAKFGTLLQRRNAVIGWLRQSGTFNLADIQAVVQPYFLYANASQIAIVETDRVALTALHTYTNTTPLALLAGANGSRSVTVADDPALSAGGVRVTFSWTGTVDAATYVGLSPPGGLSVRTWSSRDFKTGARNETITLYANSFVGHAINGEWTLILVAGAGALTLNSFAIDPEGIGYTRASGSSLWDTITGQGLGAAMYEFAIIADESKLGTGYDLGGASRALSRFKPAHTNGTIVWRASTQVDNLAIPDTRSATPDAGTPG